MPFLWGKTRCVASSSKARKNMWELSALLSHPRKLQKNIFRFDSRAKRIWILLRLPSRVGKILLRKKNNLKWKLRQLETHLAHLTHHRIRVREKNILEEQKSWQIFNRLFLIFNLFLSIFSFFSFTTIGSSASKSREFQWKCSIFSPLRCGDLLTMI